MKRFLSVIFWRKDPAAGVLFGMALCIGLGLFITVWLIMLTMTICSDIGARLLSLTKGLFALFCGLLLYILTLFYLWLTDLFQRTFKWSKWAAIPCGWLTGMVGMAVCAWKLKNRQAFVLAVAASLLFAAHVILKVNGSDLGVWLDVCSLAYYGTFFLAFCALVRRRSFYIWGIVLLVLWLLNGYVVRDVIQAHLERKVTSRMETLPQDCRVQLTREMVRGELEAREQPIPETFQEFLDASRFPSSVWQDETLCWLIPQRPLSQHEWDAFEAYETTHAAAIALLDEITDPSAPHTDGGYPVALSVPSFVWTSFEHSISWIHYYKVKMIVAAQRGETNTVLETAQRLEGLSAYYQSSQTLLNWLLASTADSSRWDALQSCLHLLSDADMVKLQQQAQDTAAQALLRLKTTLVFETFSYEGNLGLVLDLYNEPSKKSKPKSIEIGFQYTLYRMAEDCIAFARIIDDETLSLPERYARLRQQPRSGNPFASFNSLIGHFDAITDKAYVVSAGIAVERYRRRYHRLPETLEHLVPEFIGQAPVSVITGLPLGYETGKIRIPQPDDEPEFFINGYRVDTGEKSYFIVAMPEEKP